MTWLYRKHSADALWKSDCHFAWNIQVHDGLYGFSFCWQHPIHWICNYCCIAFGPRILACQEIPSVIIFLWLCIEVQNTCISKLQIPWRQAFLNLNNSHLIQAPHRLSSSSVWYWEIWDCQICRQKILHPSAKRWFSRYKDIALRVFPLQASTYLFIRLDDMILSNSQNSMVYCHFKKY